MTLRQAVAYFSDEDRASFTKALKELPAFPNSAVIDFGQDYSKWFDGDGSATERYGLRPTGWVAIYKFTAVFGKGVDENLQWLSPTGSEDNFGVKITDTIYDGMTNMPGGPWALMAQESFDSFGVGLGQGQGQKYRLRPDGVWIKVEG